MRRTAGSASSSKPTALRQRSAKRLGGGEPRLLQRHLELQRLLAEVSRDFINLPAEQIDQHINQALGRLAGFLGFNLGAISKLSGKGSAGQVTHVWTAPGLPPISPGFTEIDFPWVAERLTQGQEVHLPDLDALPPAAQTDRETYERFDVRSAYTWPLRTGSDVIGGLTFISIGESHGFPGEFLDGIQLFTQIMANALARERADQALRESEARFRTVADSAPVLIWMAGLDKGCSFFNKPWLDFTGRTLEQELGNGWAEGVHPDDFQRCLKTYTESFDARQPFVMQYRLRRNDGEYRWILDNGVPRYDAQGNFAGYIGSCVDITEGKQAEEKLLEIGRVLAEAQRIAHVGSWEWNLVTNEHLWSDETYRMLGFKPQEFSATLDHFLKVVHPDDRQAVQRMVREALADPQKTCRIEHRIVAADGSQRVVHGQGEVIQDDQGRPVRFLATIQDITERRKDEEEMQRLRLQAWHADRVTRTGAITASLAHELNQPLAAILSNAQAGLRFLARDDVDLGEIREILGDIVLDDKRAGAIISGLRAMLRRQVSQREKIGLADTIQEMMDLLHSELVGQHVEVRMRCESDCIVLADKAQIQQVILNLMMNSVEAMHNQPVDQRRLELALERPKPDEAQIAVRDLGPGVPDDKVDKLFEAFWTTKPQGLGIGLPICRSIIESHGGRIWFANNRDRGATFYFTLPVVEGGERGEGRETSNQ